jgi:formate dehydrogenase iron-sulfur subunit
MSDIANIVAAAIENNRGRIGALMPVLHEVQHALGHIPKDSVPLIAKALNLSRAEVQGVIGFYHDFKTEAHGETIVQVCRAEACQANGGRALEAHARNRLGIDFGGTTDDRKFTLEAVYCLGNCACTPSIRIGDDVHARVTPERFDELIALANSGRGGGAAPTVKSGAVRICVPMDTTALALGADEVAEAIVAEAEKAGIDITLVRTGSRGAFWLEPLVEVQGEGEPRLFGPVTPEDVASLFAAGFPSECEHQLALGKVSSVPWLARQQRLTFARAGRIDPLSIEEYASLEGFDGLRLALRMEPQVIVDQVKESGLRGRGGAAFPTGIKWQTVLDTQYAMPTKATRGPLPIACSWKPIPINSSKV